MKACNNFKEKKRKNLLVELNLEANTILKKNILERNIIHSITYDFDKDFYYVLYSERLYEDISSELKLKEFHEVTKIAVIDDKLNLKKVIEPRTNGNVIYTNVLYISKENIYLNCTRSSKSIFYKINKNLL